MQIYRTQGFFNITTRPSKLSYRTGFKLLKPNWTYFTLIKCDIFEITRFILNVGTPYFILLGNKAYDNVQ